jgi:hypothetical protein
MMLKSQLDDILKNRMLRGEGMTYPLTGDPELMDELGKHDRSYGKMFGGQDFHAKRGQAMTFLRDLVGNAPEEEKANYMKNIRNGRLGAKLREKLEEWVAEQMGERQSARVNAQQGQHPAFGWPTGRKFDQWSGGVAQRNRGGM